MRKYIGKIRKESLAKRYRRKLSIRSKISGTKERPRVCATKSNKNLFVQVIDDVSKVTLFSVQTFGKGAVPGAKNNLEGAKLVGAKVAEELKKHSLERAVFDRSGYKYTGVIAALVNGIRENGIQV